MALATVRRVSLIIKPGDFGCQPGHPRRLKFRPPLIFVFTAEPRPRYYAPLAAPVRLPSWFLVPVPLPRRLVPFLSPSPFPRLCRPRPLRALRRRHR